MKYVIIVWIKGSATSSDYRDLMVDFDLIQPRVIGHSFEFAGVHGNIHTKYGYQFRFDSEETWNRAKVAVLSRFADYQFGGLVEWAEHWQSKSGNTVLENEHSQEFEPTCSVDEHPSVGG